MRKFTAFKALAAAAAMLAAASAMAADPVVDGSGKLTGATGVMVGGTTYDVFFEDGTCATVFGTCSASSFAFQTQADARSARDALLAQVFLGTYDTIPGLTAGCALGVESCIVYVTYALDGANVLGASLNNGIASNSSGDSSTPVSFDLTQFTGQTYARFSLASTAVPEPASWAMMLLGFAGIGAAMRRSRRGKTLSLAA